MIMLDLNLPAPVRGNWAFPFAARFLGVGLIAFHFLKGERRH